MIEVLAQPPVPFSANEKRVAVLLTVLVGWTRWLALSRTMWDWDEAQFMLAMRHYNVAFHHPHPPGFPLYIGAAKIFAMAALSEFHALQAVNLAAALALFPAMLFMGRELRASSSVAMGAAVLLAFFPNVWFYGGTAFSDVPSLTLMIVAAGLLLRGCRAPGALLVGAIVAAVAIGVRPQNVLIVMIPAGLAAWRQWSEGRRGIVMAAWLSATAIGLASYGAAISLTGGWRVFSESVRSHEEYITATDSFRSPQRPPLLNLIDDFFIRPYHAPWINALITVLVLASLASLVRRRLHVLLALLFFAPLCLLTWMFLDRFSASRFSIGYAPLIALLASEGIHVLTRGRLWPAALIGATSLLMVHWSWPAIREVRSDVSPPVAAAEWIERHADPASTVYVDAHMLPYGEALLPRHSIRPLNVVWPHSRRDGVLIEEGDNGVAGGVRFMRRRGRLWDIARQRYFEVAVTPMKSAPEFGEGWYGEESSPNGTWRWMAGRSLTSLPALGGSARLALRIYVPLDSLAVRPLVSVRLNGQLLDSFVPSGTVIDRSYDVVSRRSAWNELVCQTDQVVNPAAKNLRSDRRDLGLRLDLIEWAAR